MPELCEETQELYFMLWVKGFGVFPAEHAIHANTCDECGRFIDAVRAAYPHPTDCEHCEVSPAGHEPSGPPGPAPATRSCQASGRQGT
jgi:hypothetical protein